MKKFLLKILSLALVLCFVVSAAGCLVDFDGDDNPSDSSAEETPSSGVSWCVTDLPNSNTLKDSVNFNSYTAEQRGEKSSLSLKEAVSEVKRSSVAIEVTYDKTVSSGSGTIVEIDDGENDSNVFYIVTCHHVIDSKGSIKVYVPDLNYRYGEDEKYTFEGTIGGDIDSRSQVSLVGGDMESDVAVLRLYVEDEDVAATIVKAKIMDSKYAVEEGEEVFAIGNPTGELPGTVTTGIISYVLRTISVENIGSMQLYQIDVNIRHGSSGGGLFNSYGELIGITSAGDDDEMIYYAVPIKTSDDSTEDKGFANIVKQLVATKTDYNYGYVSARREKFGFTVVQATDDGGDYYLYVSGVTTDSAAYIAGIKGQTTKSVDIITHFEYESVKTEITELADFTSKMKEVPVGKSFKIYISRQTKSGPSTTTTSVEITLTVRMSYFCDTGVYSADN